MKAEVEAAVRAYFAAMDIAGRTGDTQPYEAATTGDCTCREFAKTVEQAYAQAPLVGAGVVLRSVDVTLLQEGRAHAVADYRTLNYTQTISATPTRFPGWSVQSLIRLSRTSNGWLVIDEDVISRTAA